MRFIDLEIPAISNYRGRICGSAASAWSLDALISELNCIDHELQTTSPYPAQLKLGSSGSSPRPTPPPPSPSPPVNLSGGKSTEGDGDGTGARKGGSGNVSFVMRVDEDDGKEESSPEQKSLASGTRFSCVDFDSSDLENSEEELDFEAVNGNLMRKTSLEEGILFELERENQLRVKEEVRKRITRFKAELRVEYEKSESAILQIEKQAEARREMDKESDKHYQCKVAEELDNHLSLVQKNHEKISHREELRIRKDAAIEDAKRKEKALHEEKMRQEKANAEIKEKLEEARKDEEAKKAAVEAAQRVALEEAQRVAIEEAQRVAKEEAEKENIDITKTKTEGVKVRAADSAVKLEAIRLEKYKSMEVQNAEQSMNFVKEYSICDRQIDKRLRQLTGTVENVRAKASELVNIMNDSRCPPSIFVVLFAKKVVSMCDNPSVSFDGTAFACGHVILLVMSKVPHLLDCILAEFHRVCIYTVPKYIEASKPAFKTKDYWKMVGYREENGKLESAENYLRRIETYMKLYAALIQTEGQGVQNPLGLKEGWAWMARFLNELPPTASTATALHAFLKMAGFTLCRRYGVQFKKLLNIIMHSFLPALKNQQKPNLAPIISKLESYIGGQEFLNEPEGWRLRTHLSSREFVLNA